MEGYTAGAWREAGPDGVLTNRGLIYSHNFQDEWSLENGKWLLVKSTRKSFRDQPTDAEMAAVKAAHAKLKKQYGGS